MPSRSGRDAILWMVGASFLLASMSLAVKLVSVNYGAGEIAFYRGVLGAVMIAAVARGSGIALRTAVPWAQFWRSLTGAVSMTCFFYALGKLPLATAVTLNYTSSVWIALIVVSGLAVTARFKSGKDRQLAAAAAAGFVGTALVLRPTIAQDQFVAGLVGLAGGFLAGMAHLQVAALGRAGEPALRTVFYFSLGNMVAGAALMRFDHVQAQHTPASVALLVAIAVSATLAQLMLTRAYTIGAPLVNASLQYLSIAWAFAYGIMLFGDRVDAASVAGIAAIVVAGIAASMARVRPAGGVKQG